MKYSHKAMILSFIRLVNETGIMVYYRLLDNYLSASVAKELEYALKNGKKVYELFG